MRAVDTNVVVRYLTEDDADQAARARAVVDRGRVFVATTVLLETAWVLRSGRGLGRRAVARLLRNFAGLPGVILEHPERTAEALDRAESGMDFADALHLGAACACDALLTFDRKFIRRARDSRVPVTAP